MNNVDMSLSLSKVRGFTVDLLFALKNNQIRTIELTGLTGKSSQYLNRYLRNMRKYGLVEKEDNAFWTLTEFGRSFLSHLEAVEEMRRNDEVAKKC
jgi:predicted transcriptional regulator